MPRHVPHARHTRVQHTKLSPAGDNHNMHGHLYIISSTFECSRQYRSSRVGACNLGITVAVFTLQFYLARLASSRHRAGDGHRTAAAPGAGRRGAGGPSARGRKTRLGHTAATRQSRVSNARLARQPCTILTPKVLGCSLLLLLLPLARGALGAGAARGHGGLLTRRLWKQIITITMLYSRTGETF